MYVATVFILHSGGRFCVTFDLVYYVNRMVIFIYYIYIYIYIYIYNTHYMS